MPVSVMIAAALLGTAQPDGLRQLSTKELRAKVRESTITVCTPLLTLHLREKPSGLVGDTPESSTITNPTEPIGSLAARFVSGRNETRRTASQFWWTAKVSIG